MAVYDLIIKATQGGMYVLYEVLFSTVFPHAECQEAGSNVAGGAIHLFYVLPRGKGNENSF